MAVMSILSVAIVSAMLLAAHALPESDSPIQNLLDDSESVDRVIEELRTALHFTERTATAIAFTVPDRDNDGVPERIRYAWSAAPGDPLTREYNGASAVTFVPSVQEFALAYDLIPSLESYPGPPIESSEQILSSHDSTVTKEYAVKEKDWIGQYFAPTLPADAISWNVTRVRFQARQKGGANGIANVQLRTATAAKLPSSTVLEQYQMAESSLPGSFAWQEFAFGTVRGLVPGRGLCLTIVMQKNDSDICEINHDDKAGSGLLTTKNSESAWTYDGAKTMHHYIFGTYFAPGPTASVIRNYVSAVHVKLRRGAQPAARVVTSAETLNQPEALSAIWEADFSANPTLDYNGDGHPDWVLRTAQPFDAGQLSGGAWNVGAILDTNPPNDFNRFITADVRFRSTSTGSSAEFTINADWSGSVAGVISARISKQADGSQALAVENLTGSSSKVPLAGVTGLSADFATVRLLIDPDLNTVNIRINGQQLGTSVYTTYAPSQVQKFATLSSSGTGAQFDHVSIRVAE